MKQKLIAIGLVAALAVPTAAIAAQQGFHGRKAATTAPKTRAKGSGSHSGLSVRTKPSKTMPVGARTRSAAKPKARSGSGRKPNAHASTGRSSTRVHTRRNATTGTSPISVTISNGGSSGGSGNSGTPDTPDTPGVPDLGDVDLPVSVSGAGV